MSSDSPVSIILDITGKEVSVSDGYAVSNGNKGFASLGSDGTNLHFLKTDTSGRTVVVGAGTAGTATGGVITVQGVSGGTALPVSGTFWQTTQPISGTITANIGTSGSLALDATLSQLTISQNATLGSNTLTMVGGSVTTSAPSYTTGHINSLSLTTSGLLRVDASSTTQAVSQSGTWTVQPGNTANTTAWMVKGPVVDNTAFTDGTTPVQPAGFIFDETAGTSLTENDAAAARVDSKRAQVIAIEDATTRGRRLTVTAGGAMLVDSSATTQPISGTITANIGTSGSLALDATLAKLTIAQGASLGSNTQNLIGGSVTTSSPSYTTGQISPLSLTTAGALRVDSSATTQPISIGGSASGTLGVSGATVQVTMNGSISVGFEIVGSFSGSLIWEHSFDNTNWHSTTGVANGISATGITTSTNLIKGNIDVPLGAIYARVRVIAYTSGSPVCVITASNCFPIRVVTGAAASGDPALVVAISPNSNSVNVSSAIAHDASDSGNPIKIGSQAINSFPTAVSNGDRANALSDLFGRLLVGHIDPNQAVWKSFNATSTQTGSTIWDPSSGKKIAITSLVIGTYGATAARVIIWFGDNADTTYSAGTDQLVFAASFAPSVTATPGAVLTFPTPIFCTTADRELHITTNAGISIDITVNGYEW